MNAGTINFIEGDLFSFRGTHVLAHGVNCHGRMGAGIAKQFSTRYNGMYEVYKAICAEQALVLGGMMPWTETFFDANSGVRTTHHIANCASQNAPGANAEIFATNSSLRCAAVFANVVSRPLAIPLIGCGIGGLQVYDAMRTFIDVAFSLDSKTITVVGFPGTPETAEAKEFMSRMNGRRA